MKASNAKYLVYTKDGCPYCNQAKGLLEYYKVSYSLIYEKSPDWETYPCIYKVDEEGTQLLIGGFNELVNYSFLHGL
jgi:hypothetical protein